MEYEQYQMMSQYENHYWWYVGLHNLVTLYIEKVSRQEKLSRILDAGCGTGRLLEIIRYYEPIGLDYSEEALGFALQRNLSPLIRGSIALLPFSKGCFDMVISNDVLCCLGAPEDLRSLKEIHRVLRPGRRIILNLPAFEFMRGDHDKAVHIRRRYRKRDLEMMFKLAGFKNEQIDYHNTFLFPVAFLFRYMQKVIPAKGQAPKSDLRLLPTWINTFLTYLLRLENRFILKGVKLPFGLSLFCTAIKI